MKCFSEIIWFWVFELPLLRHSTLKMEKFLNNCKNIQNQQFSELNIPAIKTQSPINHTILKSISGYPSIAPTFIELINEIKMLTSAKKSNCDFFSAHNSATDSPNFINDPICYIYVHCVKSVQIRRFFWSVFSCIQPEYRKIRTRKNSVFGHFSRSA